MKKRILLIEILLLILMFSYPISGFASSNKNRCYLIQRSMLSDIRKYYAEYEKKGGEIVTPGEGFNKLAKDMFDKGVIKYPYSNKYGNCSYGVEVESSGDIKFYCVYHGDLINAERYEQMFVKRRNNSLPLGFFVMLVLVFISFCVSCIKVFLRSEKNEKIEKEEEKKAVVIFTDRNYK